MQWTGILSAVSAGIGAVAVMLVSLRRLFTSRVQSIVDRSMQTVLQRQAEFEQRINDHLKRQDININKIYRQVR